MQRMFKILCSLALAALSVTGCSSLPGSGWITLLDGGNGLSQWTMVGDANWRVMDGAVQADKGSGFLVTRDSWSDFEIRAEFWADEDANSGIFIRAQDTNKIGAANSYEVNIYDKRPGQDYSTGAIVDVGKVALPAPKAAGRWNVYEIRAKGNQLTVNLNGVRTVDVQDSKHARGPFALQYAPGVVKDKGVIKFRKVQIRPL
jgi:Domain of Unknown Function (DUF1080)